MNHPFLAKVMAFHYIDCFPRFKKIIVVTKYRLYQLKTKITMLGRVYLKAKFSWNLSLHLNHLYLCLNSRVLQLRVAFRISVLERAVASVTKKMLGTFPKNFSQMVTSQGYFPKWQLPKCAISLEATEITTLEVLISDCLFGCLFVRS